MVELIAAVDGGHLEALYIRLYGAGVAVLKDRYNACIVQEDLLCLGGQFCLCSRISECFRKPFLKGHRQADCMHFQFALYFR